MIAEQMRQLFDFMEVLFIPSAMPPHKSPKGVTSSSHRLIMTTLATLDNPYFQVSSLEITRGGKSYTVDTLRQLKRTYGDEVELYFLVGADAFWEISTWRDMPLLFELSRFVVIERPGAAVKEQIELFCRNLLTYNIKYQIVNQMNSPGGEFVISDEARVYLVKSLLVDISSSEIRNLISKGKSVKYLLSGLVENYIIKNHLYLEERH